MYTLCYKKSYLDYFRHSEACSGHPSGCSAEQGLRCLTESGGGHRGIISAAAEANAVHPGADAAQRAQQRHQHGSPARGLQESVRQTQHPGPGPSGVHWDCGSGRDPRNSADHAQEGAAPAQGSAAVGRGGGACGTERQAADRLDPQRYRLPEQVTIWTITSRKLVCPTNRWLIAHFSHFHSPWGRTYMYRNTF